LQVKNFRRQALGTYTLTDFPAKTEKSQTAQIDQINTFDKRGRPLPPAPPLPFLPRCKHTCKKDIKESIVNVSLEKELLKEMLPPQFWCIVRRNFRESARRLFQFDITSQIMRDIP